MLAAIPSCAFAQWTTSGTTITGQAGATGSLTVDLRALTAGNATLSLSPASSGAMGIIKANNYGSTPSPLIFQTNLLERMRIDGNGIVTVGTVGTSPNLFQVNYSIHGSTYGGSIKNANSGNYALTDMSLYNNIDSRSQFFLTSSTFANSYVSQAIIANTTGITAQGTGGIALVSSEANASIRLATNSLERMRIDAAGNVGIGTPTPDGLQVNLPLLNESSKSISNIRIGVLGATPRIILDKAGSVPFEIDNAGGQLRIFNPGAVRLVVNSNGYVGIGTGSPDAALTVKGTIHTNEVKVDLNGAVAPDYVFEKDYPLMSLEETKAYIDANKHLPEVPSAKEMEKNGLQLGEMNLLLLKKVEELTLHLINANQEIADLRDKVDILLKKR